MTDPSRVPLAQLPCGTANILGHELGFSSKPENVARVVTHGSVRKIDMGLAGDRRFLMVVSAGFDALVTHEVLQGRQGTLGYRGYAGPILGRSLALLLSHQRPLTRPGQSQRRRLQSSLFSPSSYASPAAARHRHCVELSVETASVKTNLTQAHVRAGNVWRTFLIVLQPRPSKPKTIKHMPGRAGKSTPHTRLTCRSRAASPLTLSCCHLLPPLLGTFACAHAPAHHPHSPPSE